ncbi:cytochrome P450 protein [Rutstroemia sp. NJR-2017a BVV2]|nr:cytochrome P450 protein [Rutstroemia sp. NJR-2017a BVV2]
MSRSTMLDPMLNLKSTRISETELKRYVYLYNITLHSLAKIQGPKLRGAFDCPRYWEIWTGDVAANCKELHGRYGATVRIAPTTVSFNNAEAWQVIYGQRAGKKPFQKDEDVYFSGNDGSPDIISANHADHSRIRRLLSHAFSEAALREQEPLINTYFDLLIRKLQEKIDGPAHGNVNMVRWFNFTTSDLIGDLCFSQVSKEPNTSTCSTPRTNPLGDRRDFMSYILRHNDERGMSRDEIMKTSGTLIVAGSESTATLLSGALFHLLKSPQNLRILVDEIRATFDTIADMNFIKLTNIRYLNACLQEAFRMYPPVPGVLPRRVPQGGSTINGYFLPENTSVGVHQWAAYHSENNFSSPEEYIPERWLHDPRFASDIQNVLQPFSLGLRNCIGQHLAMAEMRAILARVLWHFDIRLCEESQNWDQQKVFILWEKPDLFVKLEARR